MSCDNYNTQLEHVNAALKVSTDPEERSTLMGLKNDLIQLITLTTNGQDNNPMDNEYTQFMSDMIDEGAIDMEQEKVINEGTNLDEEQIRESLKGIEGMKCRAPHTHSWGDTIYHNAMVCSTITEDFNPNKIMVKVLFTNPTHKEMVPCPYYLETDCKFTEDKCHFSHGKLVEFSLLQDYIDPDFSKLETGSKVLAKKSDKLWHRARIRRLFENKCTVRFENSSGKDVEIDLTDVLHLTNTGVISSDEELDTDNEKEEDYSDIINTSLLISPSSQALGEWEKYTKGIGSKLMRNMGYIIGSGLGKQGEGIVDPVTAVVLPKGKSLDHCMTLREHAGGDKNLFSAERKLRIMQKREEERSKKQYEREKNKTDVFKVINTVLEYPYDIPDPGSSSSAHRQNIRKESTRNLNVESLKVEETLRQAEKNLLHVNDRLKYHNDTNSQLHKALNTKRFQILGDIKELNAKSANINNEQSNRSDKKKLTIF